MAGCFARLGAALLLGLAAAVGAEETDPFLWLEEVDSPPAIEWVRGQNARATTQLEAHPDFSAMRERLVAILDNQERVPQIELRGELVYNFWQDAAHPRGLWRRTPLASYRGAAPQWETVFDLDALALAEGKPWAWKGAECLPPAYRQCLLKLSRGGGDAVEVREFDTESKQFVAAGFHLPEAKSRVDWFDADHLWLGTDSGPGTLTDSGYPRLVQLWRRGTPYTAANTVFAGRGGDVGTSGETTHHPASGKRYHLIERNPAYFQSDLHLWLDGRVVKLDLPGDARLRGIHRDRLLLTLRSDWRVADTTYPQGALLAIGIDDFLAGSRRFDLLFAPTERVAFGSLASTAQRILLATQDNVRARLHSLRLTEAGWQREEIELPGTGMLTLGSVEHDADRVSFTYQDFVTPLSQYLVNQGRVERLKAAPALFNAEGIRVEQHQAVSRDGTQIPYFLVLPKGFVADGRAPTVLYGYGGFEISQLPRYSAGNGANWLERGGVYVVANIRGGGEFGPRWHQAAKGHQRMKNFEDFIAVAEDLIARKITSPRHLGISGGSQGGLLVGATFTLRPDLFNAVVSAVPLADMKRYHKLLAGASWMAEYGDPDKAEDWAVIRQYSPYQRLTKGTRYPEVFYWTTTRDDRVHPAHARKMVARMEALGHPVLYFENLEGGHGSGTTSRQQAQVQALQFAYLWRQLN